MEKCDLPLGQVKRGSFRSNEHKMHNHFCSKFVRFSASMIQTKIFGYLNLNVRKMELAIYKLQHK